MKNHLTVLSLFLSSTAFGVIYEGFDYPVGTNLENCTAPAAFTGWDSNAVVGPGYTIQTGSLSYGNLVTSGNKASGGNAWQTIGLDTVFAQPGWDPNETGPWGPWTKQIPDEWGGNNKVVGKTGTTLWCSWLWNDTGLDWDNTAVHLGTDQFNASPGSVTCSLYLKNGGVVEMQVKSLTGGFFGTGGSTYSDSGTIAVGNVSDDEIPDFYVTKIEFTDTGDVISVFLNPPLGAEPTTANATYTTPGDYFLRAVNWYGHNSPGKSKLDELRFGATWDEVAPVAQAFVVTNTSFADGTVGLAYYQQLNSNGGVAPVTWSLASGSLPAGLSLSTDGIISGTPTTIGLSTFTALATDAGSATASKELTIQVNYAPVVVTTPGLPSCTVGSAYSKSLNATGGTGSFTWAISGGALPTGLSLSSSGVISGTPTTVGLNLFSVQVTDTASNNGTKDFSIEVVAAGTAYPILEWNAFLGNSNITKPNPTETATLSASGVEASSVVLTRGSGFNPNGNEAYAGATSLNLFTTQTHHSPATLADALTLGVYAQATLEVDAGRQYSVQEIRFSTMYLSAGTYIGDPTVEVVFSTDNFATYTSLGSNVVTTGTYSSDWDGVVATFDVSGVAALQNTTAPVVFRVCFYNYGQWDVRGLGGVGDYWSEPVGDKATNTPALSFRGSVTDAGPALTGMAAWLAANGLPSDGSGNGGPNVAPAGDGIDNLMKYALGIAASVPGYQGHFSTGTTTDSGSKYLSLTYALPDPAPSGVTYIPEAGSDLTNWSGSGLVEVSSTVDGGVRTIVVRDNLSFPSNPQRFLRLRVTMP